MVTFSSCSHFNNVLSTLGKRHIAKHATFKYAKTAEYRRDTNRTAFFRGAETLKNGVRLMTETPIGKGHFHLQPKIDLSDIIEFPAGVWGRAPPEI